MAPLHWTFLYSFAFWLMLAPAALALDNPADSSPNTASAQKEMSKSNQSAPATKAMKDTVHKEIKAEAVGEVDGVPLDKKDMKPEKKGFSVGDLNPLKWIFKPITDVQKEVKTLGKKMTQIETPITDLQEPTVGLHQDLVNVQGQVSEVRTGIHGIHNKMGGVDKRLGRMEHKLTQIYQPIAELNDPVRGISEPVKRLHGNMVSITTDLNGMKGVVGSMSTAIIVAVVIIGLLVVVGTPVACLVAWKHRTWLLKKIGGTEKDVADLQHAANKVKSKTGAGT